jgi:hypothetical protein
MLSLRNVFTVLAGIFALVITTSAGAFAGAQVIQGNMRSFVMDIEQAVPIELNAPVELDNGDVVTVTAPITVTVALRVLVDGQGTAKVIDEVVQEPTIKITEIDESTSNEATKLGDLTWVITEQENLGSAFDWDNYSSYETSGNFIRLSLEVENLGNTPASLRPYSDGVESVLVDERGREFAQMDYGVAYEELCDYTDINPGLIAQCVMVFDVAPDVAELTLRLTRGDETAEIPLITQ